MSVKFRNAFGERVIVKVAVKEKDPYTDEVVNDNFGVLYSVGEECPAFLKDLKNELVLFAKNSGEKLYTEDGFEYLLLHRSAILAY